MERSPLRPLTRMFVLVALCAAACGRQAKQPPAAPSMAQPAPPDTVVVTPPVETPPAPPPLETLADTAFVRLADYSDQFGYELRYATADNFLKAVVYPCAECYTRAKTAKALLQANAAFRQLGYRIRFFDCYRPNSVQYKMWELVPNPQYVANPVKGSIHNRGGAVDITLETLDGEKLDMGTDFDFFGPRAHHDHTDLPGTVLENRRILKETMERFGFWSIRTEWWHYNLRAASADPVADFVWPCTTL
ncbi:M15 family metallopeptidase [Robiginitalea sp. M366]|uniref:M15 family metallopeptidase n=1 Tax=Robiginitalea aestuariiviva TaxID=3036903 RepID=UPI00240E0122|nr:M15 family metallopeptidase [Robiginitalea aestuariiviva]MDG1572688.1 M15 family metallopeptidase [Robiginitalea aestuariiviva]